MKTSEHITLEQIAELPRKEVINDLMDFPGDFEMDFTEEYLLSLSTDKLRHLLFAASLYAKQK